MKCCLTMISCALLAATALAQEKKDAPPPPKPEDNGPSLEVTMKFIQEKLKDKLLKHFDQENIVADPVSCQLTVTDGGRAKGDTTIIRSLSFREVENIHVGPQVDEDGQATGAFSLGISMESQTGVHHTYIYDKKHRKEASSGGYQFQFTDEDIANRIAKAMIHAVELCGGGSKPEPF